MTAPEGRMPVVLAAHGFSVLVTAGAVADERPQTTFPITGWWMDGACTKRSAQFG